MPHHALFISYTRIKTVTVRWKANQSCREPIEISHKIKSTKKTKQIRLAKPKTEIVYKTKFICRLVHAKFLILKIRGLEQTLNRNINTALSCKHCNKSSILKVME